MHRVKFVTKNVSEGDSEYRLITDRSEDFVNFQAAMEFIRKIRVKFQGKEVLVGNPELEVA